MGLTETAALDAAVNHRREAARASAALADLLVQLIEEQRQTNRLLWASLPPQTRAELHAEDATPVAAPPVPQMTYPAPPTTDSTPQVTYPAPKTKGRWR